MAAAEAAAAEAAAAASAQVEVAAASMADHSAVVVPSRWLWDFAEAPPADALTSAASEQQDAEGAAPETAGGEASDGAAPVAATAALRHRHCQQLDSLASMYDTLACAETHLTPPAVPLGPLAARTDWQSLPAAPCEVRRAAGCQLQVLALRVARAAQLEDHAAAASSSPSVATALPAAHSAAGRLAPLASCPLPVPQRSLLLMPSEAAQAAAAAAESASALAPLVGRACASVHACSLSCLTSPTPASSSSVEAAAAAAAAAPAMRVHAVHYEVVGALRRIVRLEKLRRAAKKARRFQHALGRFGFTDAELAALHPLY